MKVNELLENIEEGVIVINKNGEIAEVNNSALEIFGFERAELIGASLSVLKYKQGDREQNFGDLCSQIESYSPSDFLKIGKEFFVINNKSGTIIALHISILRVNNKNNKIKLIGIIKSISSSDKQLDKYKEDLTLRVVHELKNPLTNLQLSIELFNSYITNGDEDFRMNFLTILKNNVLFLKDLTEDLLMISKIDSNEFFIEMQKINLKLMINSIINQLHLKSQEKNMMFEISLREDNVIIGDSKKISQIFSILIDNAIKYSNYGSKIYISDKNRYGYISIKDLGIGIPEKDIHRLFNKFSRATNVKNRPGTGLGLYIAKQLIEAHNGLITVKSEVDIGSEFEIFFSESRLPNINTSDSNDNSLFKKNDSN